jgi:uncharacterized protein YdeI (YjbR/CyaY-like superfamily)
MVVRLLGDATSYLRMLTSASSATQVVTQTIERQAYQIQSYQNNIVGFAQQIKYSLLGAVGVLGLFGTSLNAIQRSAAAEDLTTSFGTMLQNMEAGAIVMRQIQQFAAETPLGTNTLAQAAKMLFQAEAANPANLIQTLRMLGDVVSGDEQKLMGMAYAFQQVKSIGRLMGGELIQMQNAGFNPLAEMARTSGKDITYFRDQMEKGLITFDMVRKAFETATSKGGRFFQGMEHGSKTLSGLWSTLKDDVGLTLQDIGDAIVSAFDIKQRIRDLSAFTQEIRKWVNVAIDGFNMAKEGVQSFAQENRQLLITIAKVTGVIVGLWATFKIGTVVLGLLSFAFYALRLNIILSTAAWLAQTTAILAFKGVLLIAKTAVIAFNVVWAITNTLVNAWTIALGLATGAVTVFNAVLTIMTGLLSVTNLLGAAAALAVIVISVGAIYGAVSGVFQAGKGLVTVFSQLADVAKGPLAQVEVMFSRWERVIDDVTRAMQVDFKLGWEFVVAYGRLAVEQIKDLWPPLWTLISEGFSAVAFYISNVFVLEFKRGFKEILAEFAKLLDVFGIRTDEINKLIEKMNEGAADEIAAQGDILAHSLKKAIEAFKVAEGQGAKDALKTIEDLRKKLEEAEAAKKAKDAAQAAKDKEILEGLGKAGAKSMAQVGKAAHHAHQAIEKVRASLATGPEGYSRLVEYANFLRDRFEDPMLSSKGYPGRSVISTGMGAPDKIEPILNKIERNTAKEANANPVMLYSAGI